MLGWRLRSFGWLTLPCFLVISTGVRGQSPQQPIQPTAAVESPLDQPIAWLKEAKRNYTAVKDYSCTLVAQERVNGRLQEQNIIAMKFRPQPFSVYMRWLGGPNNITGQEVAYVAGKNNNKMRVNPKGGLFKNIAGWQNIDVNDRRILDHSRHNILEAGLGNLIDQMLTHWEADRKHAKTEIKTAEYKYQNRLCLRIETIRPDKANAYCYRCVLYIDKDSKLPVRIEAYDWPRQGGPVEGELLEMFSYVNLQFNVGLTDNDFNK